MNTHAHNWMELPVLPKKRWETGNRHTKPISKQNSTHTYMHELMRTQTLERLLEVTWLLAKVENNGPMNILTFWWWSRSSLSNWGVKARSAQQLFATLFATLSLCRFLSEFWLQQMLYTFCYNSITSCASLGWKWRGVPIQHEELRMEKKLSIAANSWIITSADETRQQNRHFYRTAAASDFKVRTPERASERALLPPWVPVTRGSPACSWAWCEWECVWSVPQSRSLSLSPSFSGLLVSPSISSTFQQSLDQQRPFHPINAGWCQIIIKISTERRLKKKLIRH